MNIFKEIIQDSLLELLNYKWSTDQDWCYCN